MRIKKPAHFCIKMLILFLLGILLLLWVVFDWPCLIRYVTGIPCISCGMSRAWLAALRLDLGRAFQYHPMFWSVPLLALYAFYDGQLFPNRLANRRILMLLITGWILCYALRLIIFLSGGDAF